MKKGIKYLMIGFGMAVKLWGIPQEVHCPTLEDKIEIKNFEENFDYYNTTNIKKVAEFYDSCKENCF